ncbi:Aspartyl proteinase [Penicillium digitatum]|uniref:Aspartyl proteinase n=3 Tax=Penicillium digitatum TaxID=36651 RepID=K9GYJ9_PEND2|nr:Aspartyl proteinase [Penicillium digitatum Pd1]EKV19723.1 Aspartyl proteinase [Penicillium digitatum PHI26]EKV20780.1 Aspartyl proteinase [Penicillium digitatum Pd1]QQK44810.1 Aspartyl proteinase [Penicillium digitatum]
MKAPAHLSLGILFLLPASTVLGSKTKKHAEATTTKVSVPMQSSPLGPLFHITLGTPPQSLTVLSDWTWMSLFARSANCVGSYDLAKCIPSGQEYFNEKDSRTFLSTNLSATGWDGTSFLPGYEFAVTYNRDKVCIGDVCDDGVSFQLSDFDLVIDEVVPFGGIFGLSPVFPSENATFYPASYQAYLGGQLGPQVGFHSCAALTSKSTCGGGDMQTVFGGTADREVFDPAEVVRFEVNVGNCLFESSPLNVTPSRHNFWAIEWTGMWIGSDKVELNQETLLTGCADGKPRAVFDEGSEGNGAPIPLNALPGLLHTTNATEFGTGPEASYRLSTVENLDRFPTLTYEFQGKQNYTVSPRFYVSCTNESCTLNIKTWDFYSNGPMAFFGQTFFAALYVILDFESLQVGLAPLKQSLIAS